jgi:hypothetical protein
MTEKVKLTFQKSQNGERVIISKDGGFTVEDMTRITEAVEKVFHDDEGLEEANVETDGTGDEDSKSAFERTAKQSAQRAAAQQGMKQGPLGDKTPPAGRGQVAAKLPDGTGITKEGDVDRRTLRGTPENPDPEQQRMVKNVERQVAKGGAPEARP